MKAGSRWCQRSECNCGGAGGSLTRDVWKQSTEKRRRGGRSGGCRPQTCKYFTAPPKCNEDTVQRGEQPTGWGQKEKEEKKKQEKKVTRLEFTRSFPAQGLSKLNKATQAATYQTACMPGLFYLPPPNPTHTLPNVCECDRAASEHSVESNIRKTFSMRTIQSLLCCEIILDFIIPAPSLCLLDWLIVWLMHPPFLFVLLLPKAS